jgi:hypothetical protein
MSIVITCDATKLLAALAKAPDELTKSIDTTLKKEMQDVILDAQQTHRFITRTGMTEHSIQQRSPQMMVVEDYLDTGIASYGVYTHEAHGTWAPDRFLYNAFNRRVEKLVENVEKTINNVFRKLGLS